MAIDEVQGYKERLQASSQNIQSTAPERVAAKDAFVVIYQTLALAHKMFLEYGHAFDIGFFRNMRDSLGTDLISLAAAFQQEGYEGLNSSASLSTAIARIVTGEEQKALVDRFIENINSEVKASQKDFKKITQELERLHRHRHAAGTAASADSPTHSALTNFGGFIPGELAAALQGLLSKESLSKALSDNEGLIGGRELKRGEKESDQSIKSQGNINSEPNLVDIKGTSGSLNLSGITPSNLGSIQSAVTALLIALQSQVVKRSNIVALQQVNQILPNANLENPKLGLFIDILSLEGILGLNEAGLIPELLQSLLQNKIPSLSPDQAENAAQELAPLISQALLQLNTARVLSYFPEDLKSDYIKLLQKILQQAEAGVAVVGKSEIPALKQPTAIFLGTTFPNLAPKELGQLVDRIVSVLFGPTSVPSRDATSFKKTVKGAPSATPTPGTPPLLSSAHFQEFQHQLKFPKPLKELLAEDSSRQIANIESLRQAQLQQINKAFLGESQQIADAVATQTLSSDERKSLARSIDRSLSRLGEQLLNDQLAAKEQQRGVLADAFHNLNAQAGELADKIYLLTVLANLQRVKEADRKQALKSELQAPLTASLALSLQNAGISGAQSLAEQVSQVVAGPDFAVSLLKKIQQLPPAVATAVAEAKAKAAVTYEREKVTEVLPAVVESLIKLSNRDRENRIHDNQVSDMRAEANRRSPRSKETNYLSAFLENQLDPTSKFERRGGIIPTVGKKETMSQIEWEAYINHGVV